MFTCPFHSINITTGIYSSAAFIHMVTFTEFIYSLEIYNYLVKHNKHYHRKVLLGCFHLNGHTWSSHPHSKVRTTLYSIINNITRRYFSVHFIWMVTPQDVMHTLKRQNHFVQHNKQCHKKVLLSSFHLNGHTLVTTLYSITKFTGTTGKYCSVNFILMVTP